ncbi:hypothetical protein I7I48_03925 [Histoplasma ohiense]|nr:hypothetical protein I7I48_03925 [Histoplasma ohiense (nom. inval.)]
MTPRRSTLRTPGYLKRQRYFRCPLPIIWLEDKCYSLCISWHVSTQLQESTEPSTGCCNSACPPQKDHTGVYLHPCGIYAHGGNSQINADADATMLERMMSWNITAKNLS